MSFSKTDFNTGWTINAWIEVKSCSTYGFIDEMKCSKSGKPLNEESLFVSRTNFKHRGNETDELRTYNCESSPKEYNDVWREWDRKRRDAIAEIREIAKQFNIKIEMT